MLLAGGLSAAAAEPGALRLAAILSDGLILQRDVPARIWGWAEPDETVTVSFAGQEKTATAGKNGTWEIRFEALKASAEPRDLIVKGKTASLVCHHVLVGEIWVCSGQSNMDFRMAELAGDGDELSLRNKQEVTSANDPLLRQFALPRTVAPDGPAEDCTGMWAACASNTTAEFSAVGYYFGRALRRELGVPVGLVKSAWGGTPIEPWTRREIVLKEPKTREIVENWQRQQDEFEKNGVMAKYEAQVAEWKKLADDAKAAGTAIPPAPAKPERPKDHFFWPGTLFNSHIAPLTHFAIRGALWYQGEGNAANKYGLAGIYSVTFSRMIEDWRAQWGQGEFPFLWVQLAPLGPAPAEPGDNYWSVLQDEQRRTLAVTNTGMAVTLDIGDPGNIHPRNKLDVGERLALWALAKTYGKPVAEWSGPLYRECRVEGKRMLVVFDHAGSGLMVGKKTGYAPAQEVAEEPARFQTAGADKKWVWAKAKIVAKDTVAVWSDDVAAPVAVRYAWAGNPAGANLYNKEGLPASVFRTDDWPALPKEE